MNMKKVLTALFREVAREAENNPVFRKRLEAIMLPEEKSKTKSKPPASENAPDARPKRPSNRRTPALLDPVHLAKQGDGVLRAELSKLDIEQLRDVVAEYGMDTGKTVLKWRDPNRIIDRIAEVAVSRAQKGSAFREPPPVEPPVDSNMTLEKGPAREDQKSEDN
ncbi:MAG: hypothetical protein K0M55_01555 [Rhizobium sp.]|nr:hypothetical protein [Rhizobium sp.]